MKENPAFKPGWNKKRKNTAFTWRQIQLLVGKAKTADEWKDTFLSLSPKDQWEILYKYHSPPKQVDINQGVTVTLQIHGLERKVQEIQGHIVDTKAIEDGNDVLQSDE